MKTKNLVVVFFLMIFVTAAYAQEDKSGKKAGEPSGMGMSKVEDCMDQIAADKDMRMQMMNRMMDQVKNDTTSMKDFCRTMMKDPQMHSMMMRMMNESGMGKGQGDMMNHKHMQREVDTVPRMNHP